MLTPTISLQVRQAAVDMAGSCVIAACEDGTLWRWDELRSTSEAGASGSE
jgi:hypothetical protein